MDYYGKEPVYIQLARQIEHQIDERAYQVGDILPSVRDLAIAERLNPNTCARAMNVVVDDGYAVASPKRGYFVIERTGEKKDFLVETISGWLKEGYTKDQIEKALEEASKEESK